MIDRARSLADRPTTGHCNDAQSSFASAANKLRSIQSSPIYTVDQHVAATAAGQEGKLIEYALKAAVWTACNTLRVLTIHSLSILQSLTKRSNQVPAVLFQVWLLWCLVDIAHKHSRRYVGIVRWW
jgi:hypothetical protein